MEFEKCKLRDIADVMISGVDKKSNNDETPVRLCNFVDVYRNWAITSSLHDTFMQATAKQIEIDRFLLHKGQVAITKDSETRNDIGIATYIADDFDDVILGYHCALITPNNELVDSKYLNAFLHSNYILRYFELNATGSGMRYTLSNDTILNMPILLPSIEQQKAIGRVFSNIDKQIETLNSINRNLEQVARQLYDYWFVQFDFPNHDGKPYKSSGGEMVWNEKLKREIPTNWKSSSITAIADILSGGTPSKSVDEYWNGTIPFFGPTDVGYSIFQIDTKEHITQSGLEHCASSLFDEGTIIITARGSIGKLVVVGKQMAMNQSCYALHPKNGEFEYLFFLTIELIEHLKQKGSGSVFKSIIAIDIETSWLSIAPNSIIKDFCKVCSPIFKKIKENTIEIDRLQRLRDELLPMLLNGQVNCDLSK